MYRQKSISTQTPNCVFYCKFLLPYQRFKEFGKSPGLWGVHDNIVIPSYKCNFREIGKSGKQGTYNPLNITVNILDMTILAKSYTISRPRQESLHQPSSIANHLNIGTKISSQEEAQTAAQTIRRSSSYCIRQHTVNRPALKYLFFETNLLFGFSFHGTKEWIQMFHFSNAIVIL